MGGEIKRDVKKSDDYEAVYREDFYSPNKPFVGPAWPARQARTAAAHGSLLPATLSREIAKKILSHF